MAFDYHDLTVDEAIEMMRQEDWVRDWNRVIRNPSATELPTKAALNQGGVGADR